MKPNQTLHLNCSEPIETGKRFSMVAYSGGIMRNFINEELVDVVIDLQGLDISKRAYPIIFCHDQSQIVGHTTSMEVTEQGELLASGEVHQTLTMPKVIRDMQDAGVEWQASVGITIHEVEELGEAGDVVNGQFVSNCFVVRKSRLNEISFVLAGADSLTEALIFNSITEGIKMPKDKTSKSADKKLEAAEPTDKPVEKKDGTQDVTPAGTVEPDDSSVKPDEIKAADAVEPADEPVIDVESPDYLAGYKAGYEVGKAELELKQDEELVACERSRCMALVKQLSSHPDLLAKHLAAGSELMRAKAELADVLLASAKTDKPGKVSGTQSIRFVAAGQAGASDLEATWQGNVDDCQKKFAERKHFLAYHKKHGTTA